MGVVSALLESQRDDLAARKRDEQTEVVDTNVRTIIEAEDGANKVETGHDDPFPAVS